MQTLVKFAETVSKAMVKLLPICKSTLNIACVTETGESGTTAAQLKGSNLLQAAAGQMWEGAGHCSPWPGAAPSLLWLPSPHICQKDQVCHPLKVQKRKTLQETGSS